MKNKHFNPKPSLEVGTIDALILFKDVNLMFTDHGTYIIGLSTATHHLSVSPEEEGIAQFADDIAQAGYSATKGLFRIKWS